MRTFAQWYREQAVPQVVDLTNGGKKKDGTTYWGAIPAEGSEKRKRKANSSS